MPAKTVKRESPYLRVGTTIYKRVRQPLSSGRSVETLIPWNVETLRQDYGKSYLACIPKYDGFCTVPDHTNYRREIDGFLNRYEPIPFQPADGIFPHIHDFFAHIFGEQVELGYDYLQLLYLRPLQRLPVLLLVSDERFAAVQEKYRLVDAECARLEKTHLAPTPALAAMLTARGTAPTSSGVSLADLLRRPQITYADLAPFDPARPELPHVVTEQAEIRLKYAGYIQRQLRQVAEFTRLEERLLPPDLDYREVSCLRLEARQKLNDIRPASLGQASRISGVSPADITTLMVYLESREGQK